LNKVALLSPQTRQSYLLSEINERGEREAGREPIRIGGDQIGGFLNASVSTLRTLNDILSSSSSSSMPFQEGERSSTNLEDFLTFFENSVMFFHANRISPSLLCIFR
jgi:hypothetical protein